MKRPVKIVVLAGSAVPAILFGAYLTFFWWCNTHLSLPLVDAAWAGDLGRIQELLDTGSPVDEAQPQLREMTPLIAAAFGEHPAVVKLLLAHHANPNATDVGGVTALGWAVGNQDLESVKLLLLAGADPDIGPPGSSPRVSARAASTSDLTTQPPTG